MDGLKAILSDVLQISAARVAPDLAMKDVEAWDSLKHMELIAAIERSFGLELTFEEIVAMRSVAEIERVLLARGITS